jgi:exonuclease III
MKLVVCNIRGLNDLLKQREVKSFVRRAKVSLICLLETRVKIEKAEKIKENNVPGWKFIHNYDSHHLLRIWICWNKDAVEVHLISMSSQLAMQLVVRRGSIDGCKL